MIMSRGSTAWRPRQSDFEAADPYRHPRNLASCKAEARTDRQKCEGVGCDNLQCLSGPERTGTVGPSKSSVPVPLVLRSRNASNWWWCVESCVGMPADGYHNGDSLTYCHFHAVRSLLCCETFTTDCARCGQAFTALAQASQHACAFATTWITSKASVHKCVRIDEKLARLHMTWYVVHASVSILDSNLPGSFSTVRLTFDASVFGASTSCRTPCARVASPALRGYTTRSPSGPSRRRGAPQHAPSLQKTYLYVGIRLMVITLPTNFVYGVPWDPRRVGQLARRTRAKSAVSAASWLRNHDGATAPGALQAGAKAAERPTGVAEGRGPGTRQARRHNQPDLREHRPPKKRKMT
jgi:hypothetical protein